MDCVGVRVHDDSRRSCECKVPGDSCSVEGPLIGSDCFTMSEDEDDETSETLLDNGGQGTFMGWKIRC